MGLSLGIYVFIGILTRTSNPDQYYVAGRGVPSVYNGMATGSDWMSAASFISMAGALAVQGFGGLAYVMGWTGGPAAGCFSRAIPASVPGPTPSRIPRRPVRRNLARIIGVVAAITCSFTYLIAQVTGVGLIVSRFIGLDFNIGVFVGLLGVLFCSVLGGMRSVTWTQVAQYIILIIYVSGAGGVPVLVALWHPHSRIDLRQAPTAQQRHRHPADGRPEGERDPGAVEKDADEIAARLKAGGLPDSEVEKLLGPAKDCPGTGPTTRRQ